MPYVFRNLKESIFCPTKKNWTWTIFSIYFNLFKKYFQSLLKKLYLGLNYLSNDTKILVFGSGLCNGKIRGFQFTLRFWKINRTLRTGELSLSVALHNPVVLVVRHVLELVSLLVCQWDLAPVQLALRLATIQKNSKNYAYSTTCSHWCTKISSGLMLLSSIQWKLE